jgi:hypothetical protein
VVNATARLLYPPRKNPVTHCARKWVGRRVGPGCYGKEKIPWSLRRSNPQRVAILKAPSWPLTTDSWHHRVFDLKMKPGHVNRTGFMVPSSLPTRVTDVRKICSLGSSDKNTTRAARSYKQSSPVRGLEWPGGFQKLRFPDFMTTAQDGGKAVSFTHRPPLPPGNTPGTHFC